MIIGLITHNLSIIAVLVDKAVVMYLGDIVETADARNILSNSHSPYEKYLLLVFGRFARNMEY